MQELIDSIGVVVVVIAMHYYHSFRCSVCIYGMRLEGGDI